MEDTNYELLDTVDATESYIYYIYIWVQTAKETFVSRVCYQVVEEGGGNDEYVPETDWKTTTHHAWMHACGRAINTGHADSDENCFCCLATSNSFFGTRSVDWRSHK